MRGAVLLAILSLTLSAVGLAQQTPCAPKHEMQGGMTDMGMGPEMMVRMDALDARLDSLRVAMGRVTGSRKIYAIARLLDALVVQHLEIHREMRERMRASEAMHGMMREGGTPRWRTARRARREPSRRPTITRTDRRSVSGNQSSSRIQHRFMAQAHLSLSCHSWLEGSWHVGAIGRCLAPLDRSPWAEQIQRGADLGR